jgi:dihydrofolate reductase
MGKVRIASFSISADGFGAGPRQDLQNPLGVRGMELHGWFFQTEVFRTMVIGQQGGSRGEDNAMAHEAMSGLGAWILGRNMFSPGRGPWDEAWKGWWGDNPPYHVPVFVLTHYPRPPLEMAGGTTFHFVTDGAASALAKARAAAGEKDIRIGGGVATIRQYLSMGAVDEVHFAISPVVLGEGEHVFSGMNLAKLGFSVVRTVHGEHAMHIVLARR